MPCHHFVGQDVSIWVSNKRNKFVKSWRIFLNQTLFCEDDVHNGLRIIAHIRVESVTCMLSRICSEHSRKVIHSILYHHALSRSSTWGHMWIISILGKSAISRYAAPHGPMDIDDRGCLRSASWILEQCSESRCHVIMTIYIRARLQAKEINAQGMSVDRTAVYQDWASNGEFRHS